MPVYLVTIELQRVVDLSQVIRVDAKNIKEATAEAKRIVMSDRIDYSRFVNDDERTLSVCVADISKE